MKTECQNCKTIIMMEYYLLGSSVFCNACLQDTIPQVPVGSSYPDTAYEIQYSDFIQLLSNKKIKKLLLDWYNYSVKEENNIYSIMNKAGEAIDKLWLHKLVQKESDKQFELYQLAMSIWK